MFSEGVLEVWKACKAEESRKCFFCVKIGIKPMQIEMVQVDRVCQFLQTTLKQTVTREVTMFFYDVCLLRRKCKRGVSAKTLHRFSSEQVTAL